MKKTDIGKFFVFVAGWAKRSPATCLLHVALLVVLCGALITYFTGQHGRITVYAETAAEHVEDEGEYYDLPFSLQLVKSEIDYYPASTAPRGYSCVVTVRPSAGKAYDAAISMDHMLIVDHYRFTLVSIGHDSATLTVNHDPCGIFFTYLGYGLLFLAMIVFFFQRNTGFRVMLRMLRKSRGVTAAVVALVCCASAFAAEADVRNVIPANVARTFGKIYVYWDERPVPVQTMTRAIMTQVYGSDTYHGQSADQVMLGWIVYYDQWKTVPMVKVKSRKVREVLGIEGKYASLMDFFDERGYKLQPLLDGGAGDNDVSRVDRSVQLLASVATGSLMRIYPYMSANALMEWLSWTDRRPSQMPADQWAFIETSMRDVVTSLIKGNPDGAKSGLLKIRRYQLETTAAAGAELSQTRFRAEILYNGISLLGWCAIVIGIVPLLVYGVLRRARSKGWVTAARGVAIAVLSLAAAWLICLIALRWYIAGHWPLTNGPESMQVMALMSLCIGAVCCRRYFDVTLISMVVAGLSLAVAVMSGSASVISPLLPVLNNPLLSVHVFVIMLAYALLTIITLLSLCALAGRRAESTALSDKMRLSMVMLYPAVFLLCAGIFIGAIWANQSWGRYWGWDPKETWALITMLVYSVPLHWTRIKMFRRENKLAIYLAISYITVIVTYFGVNFLLGGLHSYS